MGIMRLGPVPIFFASVGQDEAMDAAYPAPYPGPYKGVMYMIEIIFISFRQRKIKDNAENPGTCFLEEQNRRVAPPQRLVLVFNPKYQISKDVEEKHQQMSLKKGQSFGPPNWAN